jgi:glycosyltransferase involved in cell wall biosynthesis
LVINGDALNQGRGTGATVSSLFAGWPREKLAQMYLNRTEARGDDGCCKTWRLEFVKDRLPGLGIRPACGESAGSRGNAAPVRPHGAALTNLRGAARIMLDAVPYRLSPDLLHEIHAFAPEVIYSCLGNIQLASLVERLSRLEDCATVVHLMDDWLPTLYNGSCMWAWHRSRLVKLSRDLIHRCSASLAISDKMAREYRGKFDRPFEVFMNCVDVNPEEPAPPDRQPDAPIRFVYIGGLHLDRWQSLFEIGRALDDMADDRPQGRLILHAPATDLATYVTGRSLPRSIEVGGPVPPVEVRSVLRRGDVMVHVESFGTAERRFTRLSISTKIPEYLSVGRPILAYGPGEVASCQYVSDSASGVVVGNRDRRDLTDALRRLATDAGLRMELGRKAWRTALENHPAETVRERFRQVVADAAQTRRGEPVACVQKVGR